MSFPPGTEMFQFPGFASPPYVFRRRYPSSGWVSPFGNPRIKACSHLPRGLTQRATSFIASALPRHSPDALMTLDFQRRSCAVNASASEDAS